MQWKDEHYELDQKHHQISQLIDYLPFDACEDTIEPVYKELAAWKEDLTQLSSIDDSPSQLIDYIDFLEKELKIPIVVVSVGPDRTQTLNR